MTWLLFWGVYGAIAGTNPYSELLKILDLGLQQTLELYSTKEAGLSPEMMGSLIQVTNIMRETIPRLLPGLLMSMLTITVWINMVLVNSLAGRLTGTAPWGSYTTWKLPEQLVWLPIVATLVVLFGNGSVQDAGTWLLMLSGLVVFLPRIGSVQLPAGTLGGAVICQDNTVLCVLHPKLRINHSCNFRIKRHLD